MLRVLLFFAFSGCVVLLFAYTDNTKKRANNAVNAHADSTANLAVDTPLHKNARVDSIVVIKHSRDMLVYQNSLLLKRYKISLGDTPVGHKHFRGDERTPEGLYRINDKNPNSICHKNLGISYPNDGDRAYAKKFGLPTGGDVKIHGLPNGQGYIGKGHLQSDWTNGCVAVTDEEVDELYVHTPIGIPIYIMP